MRCIECGVREATIAWVRSSNVPPVLSDEDGARDLLPGGHDAPIPEGPGATLCVECAGRRYEASRRPGAPSWEEFRRLARSCESPGSD